MTISAGKTTIHLQRADGSPWQRIGETLNGITVAMERAAAQFAVAAAPFVREVTLRTKLAARTSHRLGLLFGWPPAQRRQVMDMRAWSRRKGRRK